MEKMNQLVDMYKAKCESYKVNIVDDHSILS